METEWLTANEAAQYLKVKTAHAAPVGTRKKDSRAPAIRRAALCLEISQA